MKLTIDVRMINYSGIGVYIKSLLPLLIESSDINFFLVGDREELASYDWAEKKNVEIIEFSSPIYSIREQINFPFIIPQDTEIFWAPHYNIPLCYRGKLLVTVHDVAHLAFKHSFVKKIYANFIFSILAKKADAIITVSAFTATELMRYKGKNLQKKISIVHNGLNQLFLDNSGIPSAPEKPYILFVGNVKPNKNLYRLLKAFELIMHKIPHNLVIVGKKEGFITGVEHVGALAKKIGRRVIFTGSVNFETLRRYYTNASVFVFPSLYEGFGFPPLEAMASGVPVAASNASSIPEVCGLAAAYFDPTNVHEMASTILLLLEKDGKRRSIIERGRNRTKRFKWSDAAERIKKILVEIHNG
nr:glycosyltransferase family 1 protein [uncultured Desulfobacter sp.]